MRGTRSGVILGILGIAALAVLVVIGILLGSDAYVDEAMKAAGGNYLRQQRAAVEDIRRAIMDAVEERKTIHA
jgi:hypothetical protein